VLYHAAGTERVSRSGTWTIIEEENADILPLLGDPNFKGAVTTYYGITVCSSSILEIS
jgi:hypothetical protein